MPRYGKKTDQEVLEPINNVEKGGTTLIWWPGNKFSRKRIRDAAFF